jgi:hypothetical protein
MSFDETFEKQLVEAYDKSARHFGQLLNATIIFALAFLAFILVPLVALQREDARIEEQVRRAEAEIRQAQDDESRLTSAQALLARLPAQRDALVREQATLEEQNQDLTIRIESIEQSLDKVTRERGRLDGQRVSFDQIRKVAENLEPLDVDAFVRELQQFLGQASNVIWGNAPPESLGFAIDCPAAASDQRANCVIRTKVMQMLAATEQDLRERIIAPVARTDADTAAALEARLTEAHDNFGQVLDQQPEFWQAVVYKQHVGREFADEIARLSNDINEAIRAKVADSASRMSQLQETEARLLEEGKKLVDEITRLQAAQSAKISEAQATGEQIAAAETQLAELPQKIEQLKAKVTANTATIAKLKEDQKKIADNREAISDRMRGVQSPFGALPIGLTEAVQVFPIIVAVGLIMTLSTLATAIRLRRRYHQLLRKKYPGTEADIDEGIVLTVPLFLDPHRAAKANAWRAGVLALLLAVYGISVALIAESQRLVPQPEGASRTIENGYFWIYLALAVLLILPLCQIIAEWRRYTPAPIGNPSRTPQPEATTDPRGGAAVGHTAAGRA